ncbi:hypothetical protein T265_01219 [Opisthorchis viverrini]|uniref:Uncharacterized protein n=1 Tax=Opisthorchis viverrini TaxID=6198 RepID=A0A075AJ42_OPIVI|nr:hypothetical protein T265_01219 [Opisthorchis viverrini]KER32729.1 hypothetical protein T265_01219 [Opisthorchis viverrini]
MVVGLRGIWWVQRHVGSKRSVERLLTAPLQKVRLIRRAVVPIILNNSYQYEETYLGLGSNSSQCHLAGDAIRQSNGIIGAPAEWEDGRITV